MAPKKKKNPPPTIDPVVVASSKSKNVSEDRSAPITQEYFTELGTCTQAMLGLSAFNSYRTAATLTLKEGGVQSQFSMAQFKQKLAV